MISTAHVRRRKLNRICDAFNWRTLRLARRLRGVAVIATAFYCFSPVTSWGADCAEGTVKVDDEMIDAMANDNPQPKIVRNSWTALFPPGYDWDEETRARRAFIALAKVESEESWERLLRHLGDDRYAVTMADNGGYPRNYTVGRLCFKIAYHRLHAGFEEDAPVNEIGLPVRPRLDFGESLSTWRADRAKRRLYELQIEVSQMALEEFDKREYISEEAKRESRRKIEARIQKQRASKKPVFRELPFDGYEWYDARRAAEIWAEYRGKAERAKGDDSDGECP
jgi:hypothetical protein